MIDLKELGSKAFDYFPEEILNDSLASPELKKQYADHKAILHKDNPWDISLVKTGMIVQDRATFEVGIVTDYHQITLGKLNGGIEVEFSDNHRQIYYPKQLKLIENPA